MSVHTVGREHSGGRSGIVDLGEARRVVGFVDLFAVEEHVGGSRRLRPKQQSDLRSTGEERKRVPLAAISAEMMTMKSLSSFAEVVKLFRFMVAAELV